MVLCFANAVINAQSVHMDWYKGDWATTQGDALIPKLQIKSESSNTLLVSLFKSCQTADCLWGSVSSTPVSATNAELDPVKHADMLNGAFFKGSEKVFFDLTAAGENTLLAEINMITAEGPVSLLLEFERKNTTPATAQVKGSSIYGTLSSEQSHHSKYTIVFFNPEKGENHLINPDHDTGKFELSGLEDGAYYYSINLPEGSQEKSRIESDNQSNPLIIVNGEAIELNISVKSVSIQNGKTELTSN